MDPMVAAEPRGDQGPPVPALSQISVVAQDLSHQGVEQARRATLADRACWLRRKPEAGQRGDHQVEGIGRVAAEFRGPGQLLDRLPELIVRARPAMGQDQRTLAASLADHVQEVDIEVLHLGRKLREPVQVLDGGAPVGVVSPVLAEILQIRAVAAIGPAVWNVGHGWPWVCADLIQHSPNPGFLPVDLKRLGFGHVVFLNSAACQQERGSAGPVKRRGASP